MNWTTSCNFAEISTKAVMFDGVRGGVVGTVIVSFDILFGVKVRAQSHVSARDLQTLIKFVHDAFWLQKAFWQIKRLLVFIQRASCKVSLKWGLLRHLFVSKNTVQERPTSLDCQVQVRFACMT